MTANRNPGPVARYCPACGIPRVCGECKHSEIERLQAELKRWTGVFTGVTPEDMRRRMMDMSVAHAWLSEENFRLTAYVAELEEKGECAWRQDE